MKIFFLTLTPSPHIQENLTTLADHPEVELVVGYETFSQGDRKWGSFFPSCKTIDLESRKLRGMSSLYSPKLRKSLAQVNPDIIVIGSSMWSPNSWIARTFARRKNIPFFIFSEAPHRKRSPWFQWLRKRIGKQYFFCAAGFLGVTRQVCDSLAKQYSFRGPTLPFPYHRNLSTFTAASKTRPKNKPPRLLFVGALDENKNAALLINALKSVSKPFKLDILGEGKLKPSLMKQAEGLCTGQVNFHGNISYEEVANYMKRADYLVLPSKHDGFGMVVMEALTIGLPVIASDGVCSAVEYIVPGKNGWLFKNNDEEDLQKVINIAIDAIDNWQCYSRRAATIGKRYNVHYTTQNFVDLVMKTQMDRAAQ